MNADLNDIRKGLQPRLDVSGSLSWALTFNLCMQFGGEELGAFLEWAEEVC